MKAGHVTGGTGAVVGIISRLTDLWNDLLQIGFPNLIVEVHIIGDDCSRVLEVFKQGGLRELFAERVLIWRGISTDSRIHLSRKDVHIFPLEYTQIH